MPTCQARLSSGKPCPKDVEEEKKFCRWHDPEDQTWRETYKLMEKATAEARADIVLRLIEEHPDHLLELPEREGYGAVLSNIDLGRNTIDKKRKEWRTDNPAWWNKHTNSLYLGNAHSRCNPS